MRTKEYTVSGIAADDDGLVTAAAPAAGVALTLEAAAADLDPPREVTITSGADVSGVNFTVVGVDRWGNEVSEVIAGPNTDTAKGDIVFASVTSITPDATSAENVEVGWGDRVCTPWVITALKTGADGHALSACMVSVIITEGAADGDVEVTYSFPNDAEGDALPVDASLTVTPGTPVEAKGIMARFVLTSGADTSARVRFARPG
jgi:hypothetical protein